MTFGLKKRECDGKKVWITKKGEVIDPLDMIGGIIGILFILALALGLAALAGVFVA